MSKLVFGAPIVKTNVSPFFTFRQQLYETKFFVLDCLATVTVVAAPFKR